MTGVIDTFREMNAAANRMVALSNAISQANISQKEFGESVKASSRGLLDQATLTTNTIRLLRQENAELKSLNPLLVETAESLALVGGSGTDANAAYTSLVDAVVNGEGAIITAGGAMLDLSDATIMMESAVARLGRDLTDLERTAIVISVLEEEAARLNEEAANMAVIGKDFQSAGAALSSTWETLMATAGTSIDTVSSGATDLNKTLFSVADRATVANAAFGVLGRDAVGDMLRLGEGATMAQKTIFALASAAVDAGNVISAGLATAIVLSRELANQLADAAVLFTRWADAMANLDFSRAKEIDAALGELGITTEDVGNIFQEQMAAMEEAGDKFLRSFGAGIGLAIPELKSFGQAVANLAQGLSDNLSEAFTKGRLQNVINALKDILGPERKLAQDIEKVHIDSAARQLEIENKFNADAAKIRDGAAEKRIDAAEKQADRLNDIAKDLSRKWNRINEDSADKIEDIQEDAADRREDAAEKKAEKIAKIEEDLQKKIDAIMRRFELARLKALIDRDARALFEAEQRKREELAKATDDAKDKRDKAKDDAQKELNDINDNEAKKLAREREAAAKRLRRAQEDAEIRRLETIEQFEAQNEQIDDLETERLAEAFARFQKERKQIAKEKTKRIADLQVAHEERMFKLRAQALLEEALRLQARDQTTENFRDGYATWSDDLSLFIQDYEGQVNDLIDLIESIGNATPGSVPLPDIGGGGTGGGATGGGTGGCVPGAQLTFTPTRGDPCPPGTPLDTAITVCNGQKFVCASSTHRWALSATGFGAQTTGPQASTTTGPGLLGGMTTGGTGGVAGTTLGLNGGQRTQTTIVVQGDETLAQIFKELAFEAFTEVVN